VTAPLDEALEHVRRASLALGLDRTPADDKATAERVHTVRPGVPAHMALATIQTLRVMGWAPPAESTQESAP